jgi:hypothetical protein
MLPRLALVTMYIGGDAIAPAVGGNLSAVNSSSTCTKAPSVTLTGSVTVTPPDGGWCGGSSNSTMAATGVHVLSQTGSPTGTSFSHFECYNNRTAATAVNVSSVDLQANDVWTCAAGEHGMQIYTVRTVYTYSC